MKAIIAYLRAKGVSLSRSAIYRATERGKFPLHRMAHTRRKPRTYALRSELDRWLLGQE
jgi:predicted DNA-binding transcriptional regulator AlpA